MGAPDEEELFRRACRAYDRRNAGMRFRNPVEPSRAHSAVRPGSGVVLRSAAGDLLAFYHWTGKRLNWVGACVDCGQTNPEWYMVKDRVWKAAGYRPDQIACLGCLQNRLGRALRRVDFTDAPVNEDLTFWFNGDLRSY